MKKIVGRGVMLPRFYGIAYRDFQRDMSIAYPIPINILVSLGIRVWYWFKRGLPVTVGKETVIARGKLDFDVNEGAIINNKPLYDIITERHKGKTIEIIIREVKD